MKKILAACIAVLAMTGSTVAQNYPTKPVTIVVPFTPGNSVDILGRFLAEGLGKLWGTSVVVDNRAGAGSAVGTAHVAQAAADGYTLLFTASSYAITPAIRDDLPFDAEKDLVPVGMVGDSQYVLIVGSNVKARTLAELKDEAKTREMFLATSGIGTGTHFAGELFRSATGLDLKLVHYKSGADSAIDMIGGRADVAVNSLPTVLPNLEGGKLHAIAAMGKDRIASLPDVPTFAEQGVDIPMSGLWWGTFTPAGTPDAIVQQLNADMAKVMATDEAKAFMAKQQATVRSPSQPEFAEIVKNELVQWKTLAKENNIKAE
ncbi:tripartite tricarboxylate transporter substrate binding protein [Chelativorans sp. AA-79]|uniref:Bug family tripartite tricarboxylate transporter substrate binding protein n=1 Tax=Chelativorans sp. AA-79 TaxID=3028735 RepID=UPI0023F6FA1C|nr:tripartite tricarboxylate transporter substrate binding protein [Chelativorans sp. AA-79]WEX12272.1 tripartite tricarboxylate transporter substrate binding protein [Chelativorans sp. AA-79]